VIRAGLVAAVLLALAAPAQAKPRLHRCGGAVCGSVPRPLDPAKPHGRKLAIGFKLYRVAHPKGPAIVAVEGGPGYPSIGSQVEYRGIYAPLLRERNLLLVDNRGTGQSGLIDCENLQAFEGRTSGPAFAKRVGACAKQIDEKFGPHATDLFATAYAADDLAAVIRAVGFGKVDMYGDSYGTFFVQHFMARHPDMLHSVVLDSAYSPRDLDPWYASSGTAARNALEIVSPGSVERLTRLLTALPTGISVREVADMVQDSASDPVILRELDASVRAALAGDAVPLRRLVKQSREWSHGTSTPDYFSDGLYWAVNCLDLPQLFPYTGMRGIDINSAPDAFRPFTPAQWLTISGYSQPYDGCLDWPRPVKRPPPLPDTSLPGDVPILIVGGDLDSLTPFADAQDFGPELGDNVQVVKLPNTVHVTSEGDTYLVKGAACGRAVIRSFTRGGALDTRCTASIPPLHTPDYQATDSASIAANALADAAIRSFYSESRAGLRGGKFGVDGDKITLHDVVFTPGSRVNGTGTFAHGVYAGTFTVNGAAVTVPPTPL
jgi:pimeloyl-ACP methyl ester carboxylesterase